MAIVDPTSGEVRSAAAEVGLQLSDDECESYLSLMMGYVDSYRAIDQMIEPALGSGNVGSCDGGRSWHEPAENPLGAWHVQTAVRTREDGPLAGKTVALKDNICLANVPATGGASILRDFVPGIDATVVTRLLDAGAMITGKARCEYLSLSGGSHTSAAGAVRNPHNDMHSTGGSSSGCGALVAAGEVDLAVGCDQAGSIRMPASWCGVYGMKPTHGLVPYTGIMPVDAALDHAGPITNTVSDNAAMLEVIAGSDELDPRQREVITHRYTDALAGGCYGARIGMVTQGFSTPVSEADVDEAVQTAAMSLGGLGAKIDQLSIPLHDQARTLMTPVLLEGPLQQMLLSNSLGANGQGHYLTALVEQMHGWQQRAREFPDNCKSRIIAGNLLRRRYGGRHYAKAMNLLRKLGTAYDEVLEDYDLLMMPTMPMRATPLPSSSSPRELIVQRAFEQGGNTAPFNATGHPAMSLPCAMRNGLPVGMMLIGRRFDEPTIYRTAHAFEQAVDWTVR